MEINTNAVRPVVTTPAGAERPKASVESNVTADFASTASVNQALSSAPDVRKEEVERAAKLVETGNYPPPEIINRLARLLADVLANTPGDASTKP